jgi:ATP-binding cassette subfamily C protein CydC
MTAWRALSAILALFLRERGRALLAGALLAAATILAGIALLGLSGWFITASALAGLSVTTALAFDVFAPAAAVRFLALARTGARYGERLVTHDAAFGLLAGLRESLFRGWAAPGAARMLLARPARLLFRLTEDIDALSSLYLRVLAPAGAAFAAALGAGLAVGLMTRPLFGVALAAVLIGLGLGIPLAAVRLALGPARRRARAIETLRAQAIDLVAGQVDLVMAGRLGRQREAIAATDARLARADDALNRIDAGVAASYGVVSAGLLAAALLVAGLLAEAKIIGAPVAAACVLIAFASVEPFAALRRGAMELGRTLLAARRLAPRLAPQRPSAPHRTPPEGLAFQMVSVGYRHPGADHKLFTQISMSVAMGERVAVVGPSGAGKSTLLALIAGECAPASGALAALPATLLTQRTELFQDSLRDNLRLAAPKADDARLWAALAAAGLERDARALPHGLNTLLGESGLGLSGGQARRLALARLLLRNAPLWLLDEPTEGLDAATAGDVLRRLVDQAQGHTMILTTHIRREAEVADRLLIMDRGSVIAEARKGEPGFDAALARLRPE